MGFFYSNCYFYELQLFSKTAMVTINAPEVAPLTEAMVPTPDPRIGLDAGLFDAEENNMESRSTLTNSST